MISARNTQILQTMLLVVLCFVAVLLMFLRLFGVLFFGSTISMWAVVPSVALGGLLLVSWLSPAKRRIVALLLYAFYLWSVVQHGWSDMMLRIKEGQDNAFDIIEAVTISLLVLRCFIYIANQETRSPDSR